MLLSACLASIVRKWKITACTGTRYIQIHTWPGISHVTGYKYYSCLPVSLPHLQKKPLASSTSCAQQYCDFTFGHCRMSGGESRAQAWLLSPRHEAREFVGQRRHREAGGLWLGARDPGVGGAQLGRFVAWSCLGITVTTSWSKLHFWQLG